MCNFNIKKVLKESFKVKNMSLKCQKVTLFGQKMHFSKKKNGVQVGF